MLQFEKISPEAYNEIVRMHPEKLFPLEQSPPWGEFQDKIPGRHYIGTFLCRQNDQTVAVVSLLELTMRGYRYVWCNQGPVWLAEPTSTLIQEMTATLREIVSQSDAQSALFIRAHFPEAPKRALPAYSKSLIEKTTVVDLRQDFDQVLANMSQGARRGMRKAQKAGIEIREVPAAEAAQDFSEYYKILSETAARDGFFVHPVGTYQTMLHELDGIVRFFVAFADNKPVAWAIDTSYHNHAIYYYGASNEYARQVMAPYLLHIEIMRQLQQEGVKSYDFLGIGSPSYPGLQGVTQFKLRFGGEIVDYIPVYDLPLKAQYRPWKWAQALKYKLRSH